MTNYEQAIDIIDEYLQKNNIIYEKLLCNKDCTHIKSFKFHYQHTSLEEKAKHGCAIDIYEIDISFEITAKIPHIHEYIFYCNGKNKPNMFDILEILEIINIINFLPSF